MDYWEAQDRKDMIKQAEQEGRVVDNIDYRKSLMERVNKGEITLEEAQAELKRVKRSAVANGKITRNQAWNGH